MFISVCVLDLSTGTVWCVGVFCIVTNVQNIVGLLGFVTFITITTSYARLQALNQKQVFVRVCTL